MLCSFPTILTVTHVSDGIIRNCLAKDQQQACVLLLPPAGQVLFLLCALITTPLLSFVFGGMEERCMCRSEAHSPGPCFLLRVPTQAWKLLPKGFVLNSLWAYMNLMVLISAPLSCSLPGSNLVLYILIVIDFYDLDMMLTRKH